MAKYLDTSQISSELMQLLKEAKDKIILVSYSLQVNSQIQERLKTKSKLGTLSEITIIYGNTNLKNAEVKWMEEIEDLRIFQKKNLHAKCYINENKAIIASMNLYDYSQTTNIEMGILFTKEENPEEFEKMMADIADLKINGDRKKIADLLLDSKSATIIEKGTEIASLDLINVKEKLSQKKMLSYHQQLYKFLLENYRKDVSVALKQNYNSFLSDEIILEIISKNEITISALQDIFKNEKKTKQFGHEIMVVLNAAERYTIGKVVEVRYENNTFNYDQVKMQRLDDNSTMWYNTKRELPSKNQIVAVELNGNWFNDYFDLEETDVKDLVSKEVVKDYSKSDYKSTKELALLTGMSSQEINANLVYFGFMYKDDNDWLPTSKGKKYGAIQKEGQYGKFVTWPEEIVKELKKEKY